MVGKDVAYFEQVGAAIDSTASGGGRRAKGAEPTVFTTPPSADTLSAPINMQSHKLTE